jgi:hypothetical protein
MCADHPILGAAGLLRVAGVPAATVGRAGSPALFDRIRARQRSEAAYAEFASTLAERLSTELVPVLPATLRGPALCVRRRLSRGASVDPAQARLLADAAAEPGRASTLPAELLLAGSWSTELAEQDRALADTIEEEQARLAGLPWDIVTGSPAAGRIAAETAPALMREIRDRLAAGEDWTGKRMRQRADYLLRLLARSAFKTTPRGWLGQVALLDVAAEGSGQLLPDLHVDAYAVHRVANIHTERRALTGADRLPDAWLSMTGLHWTRDGRLCCWVPDDDNPGGLRLVRIRDTAAVAAIRQVLGSGVVRTSDVTELLAPNADEHGRGVLRDFVRHLVRLGVVQVSTRPTAELRGWCAEPRVDTTGAGFVDVYRQGRGHVSDDAVGRIGELVTQVGRLTAVLSRDTAPTHPVFDLVDDNPRPVSEIVAEFVEGRAPSAPKPQEPAWPEPRPNTPYQRLRDWLDSRADDDEIDITADVLDGIGAPPAQPLCWPVDCLVRPLRTGRSLAVLEAVLPAGVLDARFSDALRRLHGTLPQVDAYRGFLDATAERCGVEFVEILVPPQGDRSANAVRRPHYTHTWTGDADLSTYLADNARPGRYLPLDQITVRTLDGRVIAEDAAGRVLWPVCHATRVPPAPWDVVVSLLAAAAPVGRLAAPFVLGDHTTAFPGRDRIGRLVLDGRLVLAGRSVRLDRAALPRPGDPLGTRIRDLARLRATTGLPRWNFVRAAGGRRPRPVDLDSFAALRTFDRVLADPGVSSLVIEEMLPDPGHLCVHDGSGESLAAQLLVRLPHRAAPAELAEAVATSLQGTDTVPDQVVAAC